MAAPTPVSALVHSSTLVTAGVYLIIRFSPILLSSELISNFLLVSATLTIFIAGVCANFETDLKRVVALSTLSQLGIIMLSLSMGYVLISYFHLLTHALFKALLFMCAGAIIHSSGESQDIRFMGALTRGIPLVRVGMNIANFALCGVPFIAGFYSKDILLEMSLCSIRNLFIIILLMISVGLTAAYSFRLGFYSMWGPSRSGFFSVFDGGSNINYSIVALGIFAIFGGRILSWLILPICDVRVTGILEKFIILFSVGSGVLLGGVVD